MIQFFKLFVPTYVFCFCVDMLWLGFIAKGLYDKEIGTLIRKSGDSMAPNWPAALLVYVAIVSGVIIFVLPKLDTQYITALGYGALFGLVLYGTYDFTNYAVLANWSLKITVIDLFWGAFLCSMTTVFAMFIQNKL